ncbi:Z-ring formation inhibitor MciZ [Cohnella sp.]|uniref:Z-ring formation inhibitor MciZ n=1 Tax=Cohnella sp. TaxID=1883426 RepID=UPI00356A02AF
MLKKYATPMKLQLVGKAWEIRYSLRQEMKRWGGQSLLIERLPPASATSTASK